MYYFLKSSENYHKFLPLNNSIGFSCKIDMGQTYLFYKQNILHIQTRK